MLRTVTVMGTEAGVSPEAGSTLSKRPASVPLTTALVNPPQIFTRNHVASGITPPLGIAYLAAYLLAHDRPVQVIDALGEDPAQVHPFRDNALLRGLSFDQIADRVRARCRSHRSIQPVQFRRACGGGVVRAAALPPSPHSDRGRWPPRRGMGPDDSRNPACGRLRRPIRRGGGGSSRPGASSRGSREPRERDRHGVPRRRRAFVEGDATERLANLDRNVRLIGRRPGHEGTERPGTPFPARHLLPIENYVQAQEAHGPATGRWTSILSSRGCPYGCTFCSSRRTRFVARTAADVVDEMQHCVDEWGIEEFHFEDDNMTMDQDRLVEICDEITRRGLHIRWQTPNGIRASRTTREMLAKMHASGCRHVTLAPESGSVRVLDEIIKKGKDFSLDHIERCGADAHDLGMKVAAYFIIGLPGETVADVEMTIAFARRLARVGVDEVAFALFIPLPGTPLGDDLLVQGTDVDWLDLLAIDDLSHARSWNDQITDRELQRLRTRAYLTFQLTRASASSGGIRQNSRQCGPRHRGDQDRTGSESADGPLGAAEEADPPRPRPRPRPGPGRVACSHRLIPLRRRGHRAGALEAGSPLCLQRQSPQGDRPGRSTSEVEGGAGTARRRVRGVRPSRLGVVDVGTLLDHSPSAEPGARSRITRPSSSTSTATGCRPSPSAG